jgi:hypothetical protein
MALKKRPITSDDPDTERIYSHFDEQIKDLDSRTIASITKLSSDADLAAVITKLNDIVDKINNSGISG